MTRSVWFFQIRLLYKSARVIFWSADLYSIAHWWAVPFLSCGAVFMAARAGQAHSRTHMSVAAAARARQCLTNLTLKIFSIA
jgi:hypothetical protein